MVTHDEAAWILGVHPTTVWRMIGRGELVRAAPLKTAQLDRRRLSSSRPDALSKHGVRKPYFVSAREVADALGVVRQRVDQLAAADRLPYVETGLPRPRRLCRRAQIEVIAAGGAARPLDAVSALPRSSSGPRPPT